MEEREKVYENDAAWILACSFTVFSMQSGFALLESGAVTSRNEVNVMVKHVVSVIFSGATFWVCGYGLGFGDGEFSNPFCGWGGFFTDGGDTEESSDKLVHFLIQMSHAITATTIMSGAVGERTKLKAFMVFSSLHTVIYAVPAHWVWSGDGWLSVRQVIDSAGAGPVHLVGGVTGLVAALILGPREGRYQDINLLDTNKRWFIRERPPMGSPVNSLLGLFLIWWGWLGFNAGSSYGMTGYKFAARSAVNTLISSVGGALVGITLSYALKRRKLDVFYLINGILAAMVSISALCAHASTLEAAVIGIIGAFLALLCNDLLDNLQLDDPIGCVGVHAVGGFWGLISAGLFAGKEVGGLVVIATDKVGLFRGGGWTLLGYQTMAAFCITFWSLLTSMVFLKLIDLGMGLRVTAEEEKLGSDIVEHGVHGDKPRYTQSRIPHDQWKNSGITTPQSREFLRSQISEIPTQAEDISVSNGDLKDDVISVNEAELSIDSEEWQEAANIKPVNPRYQESLCSFLDCSWIINRALKSANKRSDKQHGDRCHTNSYHRGYQVNYVNSGGFGNGGQGELSESSGYPGSDVMMRLGMYEAGSAPGYPSVTINPHQEENMRTDWREEREWGSGAWPHERARFGRMMDAGIGTLLRRPDPGPESDSQGIGNQDPGPGSENQGIGNQAAGNQNENDVIENGENEPAGNEVAGNEESGRACSSSLNWRRSFYRGDDDIGYL